MACCKLRNSGTTGAESLQGNKEKEASAAGRWQRDLGKSVTSESRKPLEAPRQEQSAPVWASSNFLFSVTSETLDQFTEVL